VRKSPDITKYDPDWQIIRSQIKGPKTSLEDKLKSVKNYFDEKPSQERWERVVNFLEGLAMGYKAAKNQEAISRINQEIKIYGDQEDFSKENTDPKTQYSKLLSYPFEQRLTLWKDLFKTNKKWLEGGYFHKEANDFMDMLYSTFTELQEQKFIPDNYSHDKLISLRIDSKDKDNTHKFFF
jgi:rhamnogalacturonyl hydrolase YesR